MISYEDVTYESILERMLESVSEKYPEVDTRANSLAYNALATAAVEINTLYSEQDACLKETFAETATREGLAEKMREIGLSPHDATYGEFEGEFNLELELGTRFNNAEYNYSVIELISAPTADNEYYRYKLLCDTAGSEPNNTFGNLTPVDYVEGLEWAQLTECIKAGEDEEDDEAMRIRYFYAVNNTRSDGNISQYMYWAEEFDGIGKSKVFPTWNGANTVKVSVVSPEGRAISTSLLAEFQEYIDPNSEGLGNGQAPIGAKVTCTTATELAVNVSCTITLADGYTDVNTLGVNAALTELFAESAYSDTKINYMKVGACILDVAGVDSIDNLTLNGTAGNINLSDEQIAVLGTLTLTEG